MHRKVVLYTAVGALGLALACSKSTPNPTSPSSAAQPETEAAPDGSTLKAPAPTTMSPTGGGAGPGSDDADRLDGEPEVWFGRRSSYRFEVRSGSTVVAERHRRRLGIEREFRAGRTSQPDTNFTWRVRAEAQGAFGPWSTDASFRSPVGAYIRGNEIRDPLTIGRTVGTPVGSTRFTAQGLQIMTQDSHVRYALPQTLEAGEFSVMVTGFDEGSPGDKTKIMSMQEGTGDITANDYRFTAEKRGAQYFLPGATVFRIIAGGGEENIHDSARIGVAYSDERWYLWKFTWGANFAQLDVREDSETGRVIYSSAGERLTTRYRPVPHTVYLGAPVGPRRPDRRQRAGCDLQERARGSGSAPGFPAVDEEVTR